MSVRPKKHLGQHFLTDVSVAKKVADLSDDFTATQLIEIGPGTGMLTKELLTKDKDLVCAEVDRDSIEFLSIHHPDLRVLDADFLKLDLSTVYSGDIGVIGNFPYNISSQIMFKILDERDRVTDFAGMFQLEVAQRIAEKPNSKTYGILSVLIQAFYDVKIDFKIPPGVFNPPPKVMSAAISGRRKDNYSLDCDEKLFFRVVKACFNHRRKTIANNLKGFNIDRETVLNMQFAKLRAENLTVEDFVSLTQFITAQRNP